MIFDYNSSIDSFYRFLKCFQITTTKSSKGLYFQVGGYEFLLIPKKEHFAFIIFVHNNAKNVVHTTIWKCIWNIYRIYFQKVVLEELIIISFTKYNQVFSFQLLLYFSLSSHDLFLLRQEGGQYFLF